MTTTRAVNLPKPIYPDQADLLGDGPLWAASMIQHDTLALRGFVEIAPHNPQKNGDIGGDDQWGESWNRRYVRALPGGLWAVVDDSYYVAYDSNALLLVGNPGPVDLRIDNQVSWITCTDPTNIDETLVYSDYTYRMVRAPGTQSGYSDDDAFKMCSDSDGEHFEDWTGGEVNHTDWLNAWCR